MGKAKIRWWAACDGVACMGPYESEVEAWRAMELSPARRPKPHEPIVSAVHASGARVWPAIGTPKVVEVTSG